MKYRNATKNEFTKKLSKIVQEYASNNSIEMIMIAVVFVMPIVLIYIFALFRHSTQEGLRKHSLYKRQ